jgi:5-methylthioadenosine/S-adenosylhomocysteine deaminase
MTARRYAARWVVPVEQPPVEHGAVLIAADGHIAAAGPDSAVPAPPGVPSTDLGRVAVLPGLVNSHTHLELTGLEGQNDEVAFPGWIRRTIELKAGRTPEEFLRAAREGISRCWSAGITTVADTGDSGAVVQALAEAGASGIAYHEVFGPDPALVERQFCDFLRRLNALRRWSVGRVRLGASPHAPYSVSGPLYRRVAEHAREEGLPLAVHLAESAEETDLLEKGRGPFAEQWKARGIPLPPVPGRSPVAWLEAHGALGPRTLCIHAVRADPADLDRLATAGAAVAHCPRSNRRHAGRDAPLRGMLDRGLRVGVGTDSVVSVSPADLLAEARAARALAGLTAAEALRLATLDAARALGLEREIGSIGAGKWADLAVFRLPAEVDPTTLPDTLLRRQPAEVVLTVLGGREVWRADNIGFPLR